MQKWPGLYKSLLTMKDGHNEACYYKGMGMQSYIPCELADG